MNFLDGITYSQDEQLICLTNKDGIQIFDTKNFEMLLKLNQFVVGLQGDVYKAKIFNNSNILAFTIIESHTAESKNQKIIYNDSKIKVHSLVIYDLKNFEIIGKISMKNFIEIDDFLITKYLIVIMLEKKNKALLFKTSTLEYFMTITDAELGRVTYNDDYYEPPISPSKKKKNAKNVKKDKNAKTEEQKEESELNKNMCVLAYQDSLNKKQVVLMEFLFGNDPSKILGVKKKKIEIQLNSSELKYVGLLSKYLVVSSSLGNKVHMYDPITGEFKYCLFLGNFPYEISGLHLDNKQKIISIVTNNKYLKLYKLNKLNKKCNCHSHKDEKVSMNEERGVFDKFKHKLGVGRNDFLCRFKVNVKGFDMKDNKTLILFDRKRNDLVYIIQLNKTVKELLFDRKKNKDMSLVKNTVLKEPSANHNKEKNLSEEHVEKEVNENKESGHNHHMYDDDDLDEEEAKKNGEKKEEKEIEDKKVNEEKEEKDEKDN